MGTELLEEVEELTPALEESEDNKAYDPITETLNGVYTTASVDAAVSSLNQLTEQYTKMSFQVAADPGKWYDMGGVSNTKIVPTVTPKLVQPTRIGKIWNYGKISPEVHGNKAASLQRLIEVGCTVPDAWVLPCEYTFSRPPIDLSALSKYNLYAVRSGAPVSMPGLLDTELNVPWDRLEEAINKVWDSWNSPHAIDYRKDNGLSDSLGTGVTIQEMVTNIDVAFVAFTNSPKNGEFPHDFNPVIEYVEGVGESLVGGTSSGKVANGSEKWYDNLECTIKWMHNDWGPSDIEGCVDKYGTIFFVQQRALKFAAPVIQTENAEAFGDRKVISLFKPIGAPVTIAGVVVNGEHIDDAKGKIIYLTNFEPKNYTKMRHAAAIICSNGGETCHAAIVAREMGKAAISGFAFGPELFKETGVVINGSTGVVYEALPEDLAPPSEAVPAETVVVDTPARLRPNLGIQNVNWLANKLLYRFYRTLNDFYTGQITEERKNQVVDELAHILSSYFYGISVCELRHIEGQSKIGPSRLAEFAHELGLRGVALPIGAKERSPSREQFFEAGVPQPGNLRTAQEVISLVHRGFTDIQWGSSFGGEKWGTIAQMVKEYLMGELSSTLFVDFCFNLQHNSGRAFNKFTWFSSHGSALQYMLDAKKGSYDRLESYVKTNYKLNYQDMVNFATEESILPEDLRLGPDEPYKLLDTPAKWVITCNCEGCGCIYCYPATEGKCDNEDTCYECYPCECKECGCKKCFYMNIACACRKFECDKCVCGCKKCGCSKCFKSGQCGKEDTCWRCYPCNCYECGCKKCFRYSDGQCQHFGCEKCPCGCGDCGCHRCFLDGKCDDDDCSECNSSCACRDCGCEDCFEDGLCEDEECNECHPCECCECGCERCFGDGPCNDDECTTCHPCFGCDNPDCEQCHGEGCACPTCTGCKEEPEPEVSLEQPKVEISKLLPCDCESCKEAAKELEPAF